MKGEVEQPHDLFAIAALRHVLGRPAGVYAANLVRDARAVAGDALPRGHVGVQVGEDEVDEGLAGAAKDAVDSALDGGRGAAAAGAEVNVGVGRDVFAELPD